MQIPLEIVFEGMDPSDAVRDRIEQEVAKLEQFHDRITSCRVVVEAPRHHKAQGGLFGVRVHITLPGHVAVEAQRNPDRDRSHEDAYVAIRDVFKAARRQLQDRRRKQQGKVKAHETPPHGRVTRLFADEDYGFIEDADGREVYFHRNAVLNDGFDRLAVGQEVRFADEMGDKGPQATTVQPIGKHHPV
ncbi:MAG: HPF/RaiA family ribosome-associated protein [Alphaproteobacteria bacterium]